MMNRDKLSLSSETMFFFSLSALVHQAIIVASAGITLRKLLHCVEMSHMYLLWLLSEW